MNGKTTPLPDIDDSDFPKKYVVRVYGDDPRSGCIYCAMETAEEMRNINEDGYWEWLEPIPSQNQEEGWNAIVSRIAAADLMSKTIPGDNESVERWKKKAIDVLSKQFILIKKEQ